MRCALATIVLTSSLWVGAAGSPAQAGPWAREDGTGFLSASVTVEDSRDALALGLLDPSRSSGAYGEYGLGRGFTLGATLDRSDDNRMVVGFLRYTLTPPEARWQVAVDAGLGRRWPTGQPATRLVRLGGSVGYGLSARTTRPFPHEGGWITLDAYGLYEIDTEEVIWQAETTFGLRLTGRTAVMLQVKAEEWPGSDPLVSVAPSVVRRMGPRTSLQLGARANVAGSDRVSLTLALWQEF